MTFGFSLRELLSSFKQPGRKLIIVVDWQFLDNVRCVPGIYELSIRDMQFAFKALKKLPHLFT
jgi:hypothetical protein